MSHTQLCSYLDLPAEDFTNQIALVARGNCTFYEKVRLAQGSGARGLLIVSKERLVRCLVSNLWGTVEALGCSGFCMVKEQWDAGMVGGTGSLRKPQPQGLWFDQWLIGWRLLEWPLCQDSAEQPQGSVPGTANPNPTARLHGRV